MEAKDSRGKRPPSGPELGQMLASAFLDSSFDNAPLSQIAEYAISENDLVTVQQFIVETLRPFSPGSAHDMLTRFQWHGLATTNYDTLIETAYSRAKVPVQTVVPFISDHDRIDRASGSDGQVVLLKLHGCVTRHTDPALPFIITPDQFWEYKRGRTHVFQQLCDWGREHSFVFLGQRLDDGNLRAVIRELDIAIPSRPRSYLVIPSTSGVFSRFWEKQNVRVLPGTFSEFSTALQTALP